jgi:membrane-bound ClpP family serine protease
MLLARADHVTCAELVDTGSLVVAIVGPVLLVLRWKRSGVLLGAAFAWLTLIVAGEALSALDPSREGALGDSFWVLFGWVATLAYSSLIYAALRITRALWLRRTDGSRADEP